MFTSRNVISIQILRAVAAILVFFAHFSNVASEYGERPYNGWVGGIGVDIFFIISGFVMFMSMDSNMSGFGSSWTFFSRRISRVVPIYWMMTFVVYMIVIFFDVNLYVKYIDKFRLSYIISSMLFSNLYPIVAVGWTLTFEMFFYMICSLSILFSNDNRVRYIICVIALILSSIFLKFSGLSISFPYGNPYGMLSLFCIGGGLYFILNINYIYRRDFQLFLLSSIVFGFIYLYNKDYNHGSFQWILLSTIVFIFFVSFERCMKDNYQSFFVRFGISIGDGSYSMYLIHLYVIVLIWKIYSVYFLSEFSVSFVLLFCFSLGFAICLSVWMFANVENYLNVVVGRALGARGS